MNDINTLGIPEERANFYLMRVRQVESEIASGHMAPILYFINRKNREFYRREFYSWAQPRHRAWPLVLRESIRKGHDHRKAAMDRKKFIRLCDYKLFYTTIP